MLERFKRDDDKNGSGSGAVATTTRTDPGDALDAPRPGSAAPTAAERAAARAERRDRGPLTGEAMKTARTRQREEFGGLNWGASFFGWLVAVGVGAIITGLLAAMGAAVGLTSIDTADVESIGLGGGLALLAALMLAYFCGGYVAGRMSRFDGARQGIGVWVIALVVTVVLALLALVAGDEYNVLEQLGLPALPVGESELASGGWIALLAIAGGTLFAALTGGKAGERYHRRVDRAGFVD
jgi:hypothetical protein